MKHFNDTLDDAFRTGSRLDEQIWNDTLGSISPITVRIARLQMLGPCQHCGEKEWVCDCELEEADNHQRADTRNREAGSAQEAPAANS